LELDALKLLKVKTSPSFFFRLFLFILLLLLSKCNHFLTKQESKNPTGKMAIGQISETLFFIDSCVLPFWFQENHLMVGILAWSNTLCFLLRMVMVMI
jgi:hypothetical protein